MFSLETWFRTTTTSGGKIVGFGNANTGTSTNYDRHIYMEPNGRITFGVYNNGSYTATSPGALNDGQWHQAVGTMGPSGRHALHRRQARRQQRRHLDRPALLGVLASRW